MTTNKSPAFQFYPKDFISDINVISMTLEERGLYITLLCHDWLENGLSEQHLKSFLGQLKGGSRVVEDRFEPHLTKVGFYTNKRLQEERQKQQIWREKSSFGGKKSAITRKTLAISKTSKRKGGCEMVQTKSQPKVNIASPSTSTYIKDTPYLLETPTQKTIKISSQISMTQAAAQNLVTEFGKECCEYYKAVCNDWLASNGKRKKDYAAFMRNWIRKDKMENKGFFYQANKNSFTPHTASATFEKNINFIRRNENEQNDINEMHDRLIASEEKFDPFGTASGSLEPTLKRS